MTADRPDDPAAIVRIEGENLDATAAPRAEGAVRGALAGGPVVLDLARVRFADSAGLGLLVRLAREWPGAVSMANVHPSLRRCLARVSGASLPPEGAAVAPADAPPGSGDRIIPFPGTSLARPPAATLERAECLP